jgi:hypothetical protein
MVATLNVKERRRLSVLAHAFKQLSSKLVNKAARDLLEDGKQYDVAIKIDGSIDGHEIPRQSIGGTLTVGHDEKTTSNENANPAHVLAIALEMMPKTKRRALLDNLPKQFTAGGAQLPEVSDEALHEAEGLFKQLRGRKEKTRRGGVAFVQNAD